MEGMKLGGFEENVTADRMLASNVLDRSSTMITFLPNKRRWSLLPKHSDLTILGFP